MKIRVVCATRQDRQQFLTSSALGRSLALYRFPDLELRLFERNARGLSSVYNQAIAESVQDPAILLFIHDDVHLCDFYWAHQLVNGLKVFDVVGLAGNRRRVPRQPGWAFVDERFTWDSPENLSGTVGHGHGFPADDVSVFGPTCQSVKLLDGVLLAVHSDSLHRSAVRFDERFDFHFYDMDFCRQAEQCGLKLGTWCLSVIHESGGSFGSESWRRGYERYLEKWQD